MSNKLFVIAGHHHDDPGAISNHESLGGRVKEADLTIELRELVIGNFKMHNGNPVIRDNDRHDLRTVIARINEEIGDHDIMIDIHFNAFNGKATGVEMFVPDNPSVIESHLASDLARRLSKVMGLNNRGVKTEGQSARGRIGILRGKGHRVLIEVCFKDNPKDMEAYQINKHLVANEIAESAEKHLN
jgi:N-acetylmuramoyl-L-alanine amidase